MCRGTQRDFFLIQARLFRLLQVGYDLTAELCEELFRKFDLYEYIKDCYEEYHVQGDEANLSDMEEYLKRKSWKNQCRMARISPYEYSMQVLAIMAAEIIAKTRKISKQKAYSRFMVSKTGEMLFDESTDLWMNGPDYIVDEYKREMKNRMRRLPR